MVIGVVKWFDPERGYGFIEVSPTEDAFVHYSAINIKGYKYLNQGDVVRYELARRRSGYIALNVTPL